MLMLRMMNAFDARAAEEGRSYFSKRGGGTLVGEPIFDERVTITSDPAFGNAVSRKPPIKLVRSDEGTEGDGYPQVK